MYPGTSLPAGASIDSQGAIVTVPGHNISAVPGAQMNGMTAIRSISGGLQQQQQQQQLQQQQQQQQHQQRLQPDATAEEGDSPTDVSVIIQDYAHVDKGLPIIGRNVGYPPLNTADETLSEYVEYQKRGVGISEHSAGKEGRVKGRSRGSKGSNSLDNRKRSMQPPTSQYNSLHAASTQPPTSQYNSLQEGKTLPANSIRLNPQVDR